MTAGSATSNGAENVRRVVLDSGALIKLERRDLRMIDVLERVMAGKARVIVPRTVIAETWRGGPRQARVAMLLRRTEGERPTVTVDELSPERAKGIGIKIGECGHDDIVDVHVALCARGPSGGVYASVMTADRSAIVRVDDELASYIVDV